MKKIAIYNIQALALIGILFSVLFLSSCKEDETSGSGEVTLLSFGPSGVEHGDEIVFIGTNLDKVSSITLPTDVVVSSDQFSSHNANQIKIIVPESAEAGRVKLTSSDGEIESKSILNFKVPVEITSMPAEGKPGTNLTITGTMINWIESVTFHNALLVEAEDFVSISQTELVVQIPMEAETGNIIFHSGGTDPLTFGTEEEFIVTLPEATAFNPASIRHDANLTIAGTDLDLVNEVIFSGDVSVLAANFVSQSATEIVVTVPSPSESGAVTMKQLSPVDVVTTIELTIILPVGTSVSPEPAVPGTDNLTITGTDLDLVASLELPSVGVVETFVSQSMTEIVVAVPAGAESGSISYTTVHGYSGLLGVNLIVPGEGPAPLGITMYDEGPNFGGGDWSWGAESTDMMSTEAFYSGSVSFKHVQSGGDGGASVGGMTGIDATSMNVLAFSLYGGPGTDGKGVAAVLGSDGGDVWSNYNSVTLVEGAWTEYELDLSLYPDVNLANVTRFILKMEGTSGGEILYADRVGFDLGGPKALSGITLFDEGFNFDGQDWSWGASSTDPLSAEQAYAGSTSFKHVQEGGDGGIKVGNMSGVDASGMSTFNFALYGGAGTDAMSVAVILGSDGGDVWDNYNSVSLVEGQWTEYSLDLSLYPDVNLANVNIFLFKIEGTAGGEVLYADRVGFE